MGLFSRAANTWNDQILVEAKRIFGLPHDATEQEVHEAMRRSQTVAEMTAAQDDLTAAKSGLAETERQLNGANKRIHQLEQEGQGKPTVETEMPAEPEETSARPSESAAPIDAPAPVAESADNDADENRVETLTQEVDTLRATVDTLQTEMETMRQQMAAMLTRLEVVEKMPAATHTGGATASTTDKAASAPVWEQFKKQYGL